MSFALRKRNLGACDSCDYCDSWHKRWGQRAKTGRQTPSVATATTVAMGPTSKSESTTTAKVVPIRNPDRWCWPNGPAMNGQEIAVLNMRNNLFLALGWDAAEAVADRMVRRDRESDDRVVCLECVHYTRQWCANANAAELSPNKSSTQIATDLITLLQRCPGFLAIFARPVAATFEHSLA